MLNEYSTYKEVATHNKATDCWIILRVDGEDKILDVTNWLNDHPGGGEILLKYAGKDATDIFTDIGHSPQAYAKLREFIIGKVAPKKNKKKKEPSPRAVNDSAFGGIDRFGYSVYAQAITSVLREASVPICVGIYARWGSGKSFLIQLLKQNFDSSATKDKRTYEMRQWFEEGYIYANATGWEFRKMRLLECFRWLLHLTDFADRVYALATIRALAEDMAHDIFLAWIPSIFNFIASVIFGHEYDCRKRLKDEDSTDWSKFLKKQWFFPCFKAIVRWLCCVGCKNSPNISPDIVELNELDEEEGLVAEEETSSDTESTRVEYVFVDFNCWEYAGSDELWIGLIRNLYDKVELRLQQTKNQGLCNQKDYKLRWRVKKGKKELYKKYGVAGLRLLLSALITFVTGVGVVIVLSVLDAIPIWNAIQQARAAIAELIGIVIGFLATFIPAVKFVYDSYHSAAVSRGEVLYQEADSSIRDKTGFMNRVRSEVNELFEFMADFAEETNVELKLVLFLDDLDRCFDGRDVKVLEAIQLVLAIPGAPVIAFMAIDSRVVVASIEATINRSLDIHDALITGWEFLDKIIQIPFCLPEAPPEKIERLVHHSVEAKAITVKRISQLLRTMSRKINMFHINLPKHNISDYDVGLEFQEQLQEFIEKNEFCFRSFSKLDHHLNDFAEINDDELLRRAGNLFTKSTRHGVFLSLKIPEGQEILCQRLYFAISHMTIQVADEKDILEMSKFLKESFSIEHYFLPPPPDRDRGMESFGWDEGNENIYENMKKILVDMQGLPPDKRANLKDCLNPMSSYLLDETDSNLVPQAMALAMSRFCKHGERNPRRIKRIVNVIQIISEISRLKPLYEYQPRIKINSHPKWDLFSQKLAKWVFLCENYPYRISFLVVILTDFHQKAAYNSSVRKTYHSANYQYGNSRQLFIENKEERAEAGDDPILSSEPMFLANFYFQHVERYIYTIRSYQKLNRLDGDPEEFAMLLTMPLTEKSVEGSSMEQIDIVVDDVIGRESSADNTSGQNPHSESIHFSLLNYSFNLNPSMRRQIGIEMNSIISEHELANSAMKNGATGKTALTQQSIWNKLDFLSKKKAHDSD